MALLLGAAALAACDKNTVQNITGPAPSAAIKFFNFGVSAPGVNFYADTAKMTAISSASCTPPSDSTCYTTGKESSTGTTWSALDTGVGAGGFYTGLTPGQHTLTAKISAAGADKDRPITSINSTLDNGKYYSFYTSGFYDGTAKTVEGFVIEDAFPAQIDWSTAYVRFVNASPNSVPMTLFAKNTTSGAEAAVGATIAYKAAGAFVAVAPGVYDLNTRAAGSATNLITRTTVSFVAGKVYTISARGDMTVTSTTSANRPTLNNNLNR